ncbi:histidine kinase [Lutibacter sp. A64]|uniref:sensor histidine kinase n=1 Tax=Lutibacter sp. A64 TaxID=2918526 RepID=UPI001F055293|nr:histidine kinase [Lutibacter sp. A64]UMB52908.1 histidine kinase [Lutibacter sp. A64]
MLLDYHSEIYAWIRGGLFILFIYHILIFFQNRSKLYLYYSLYLLGFSIYLIKDIIATEHVTLVEYLNFPIQIFAYAAYVLFARELLDSRSQLLKWDKFYVLSARVLVVLGLTFLCIQYLFGYQFQIKAFTLVAPFLSIFGLFAFYIIITKIKSDSAMYFVIATSIHIVFANITYIELFIGAEPFHRIGVESKLFIYIGLILQAIIFSVIIGSIIKKIEDKSKNAEVRLAIKLKEMEELKMAALQSQMNPHFVFNSLNSINNFVIKSEVEKASDYITKFSKLIRVILNSSSSPTSTLSEELEILALYVKLEKMRVNGGFNYIVNVDDKLSLQNIKVPTLFLQPFIENAIWHGIMKLEGEKKIELTIKEEDGNVVCIVEDNGIGINKAKELSHMSQKRKFFGAEATENRIRMLHQNKDVRILTKDISSNTKTGTQVSIKFPLI